MILNMIKCWMISLLCLCLFSKQVSAEPMILSVFGDSLSVGHQLPSSDSFVSQLQNALEKEGYNITTLNHSKSGRKAMDGINALKQYLKEQPKAVILELGVNDAFANRPIAAITSDLQKTIDVLRAQGIAILLVGMKIPLRYSPEYRADFEKMYENLAKKNHLMLYPFFMEGLWDEKNGTHAQQGYFLPDGIHPTKLGVAKMVKNILPTVKTFLSTIKD